MSFSLDLIYLQKQRAKKRFAILKKLGLIRDGETRGLYHDAEGSEPEMYINSDNSLLTGI
jgi:hypothetical protein